MFNPANVLPAPGIPVRKHIDFSLFFFDSKIICLILSFPIAIMASIYLEEFAPKNKITDFIEININNLALFDSNKYNIYTL